MGNLVRFQSSLMALINEIINDQISFESISVAKAKPSTSGQLCYKLVIGS